MKKSCAIDVHIEGTHCASCEVLLERRLRKIPGVTKATVTYATGSAHIESTQPISHKALAHAINNDGYRLRSNTPAPSLKRKDYLEISGLFLLFIALFLLGKRFDLLPDIGITQNMSLGLIFLIGLIAGTSTCLAVTGGLLLALAAQYSELHPNLSGMSKFKPTVYFNIGRVIGYTFFGAALGALGSLFSFSPATSGVITLLAAIVMIVLGLQMLRVFSFLNRFSIRMPKFIAHRIHDKATGGYKPWAPFVLGAGTFFVPCGFTQALQFYVLAQGSAFSGGLVMLAFSLGTLPMLFAAGALASFTKGAVHKHFIRGAAVLVILLGLFSIPAGITLVRMALG